VTPLPLLDPDGVTVGRAELAEAIAAQPIKQHLIHETVVAELAARRAGTHSTKTRGNVRGGGAKPWRQKGTGRARQGSIRAPHWTGGGVVFGPTPRTHGGKVNRKVRAQAFRAAFRAQAERGSLALMDPVDWDTPSTKRAVEYLRQAPDGVAVRPLLLVVADLDGVQARSFRNLPGVYVLASSELETVDVVAARAVLVERAVWERIAGAPAEVEAVEAKRKPKPRAKPKKKAPEPAPVVEEPVAEEPAADEVVDEPAAEAAEEPAAEVAEEPVAETAVEEEAPAEEAPKPKRTRAKKPKAEPEAEAGTEPAAEPDAEAGGEEAS
jgi:large subunit ribosomal protein L4